MAHPPGYPLYGFIASVFPHLGSPAFAAALFSAVSVVGACVLCFFCVRDAGASAASALTTASSVLATGPVLFVGAQAEVFALHLVLVAAVVFAAGRVERGAAYSFLLAFCFTLGASLQHTLIFLAPVVLVSLRRMGATTLGIVFGLTPFLMWLSVDSEKQWVFAPVASAADLFDHVFRRMYGSFALMSGERRAPLLCVVFITLASLSLPVLVNLARRRALERFDKALFLNLLFAGPGFGLLAAMDPRVAPAGSILIRFAAMPVLLLALLSVRIAKPGRHVVTLAALFCAVQALVSSWCVRRALDDHVDAYARTLLASAPESAVIVTARDHVFFPLLALQLAEGLRPDVVVVSEPLLVYGWFRARLPERLRASDAASLASKTDAPVIFDVPSERVVKQVPLRVFGAFAIANSQQSASLDAHLRAIAPSAYAPVAGTTGCNVVDDLLDAIDRARALGDRVDESFTAKLSPCASLNLRP
jgi:hypothetical protein